MTPDRRHPSFVVFRSGDGEESVAHLRAATWPMLVSARQVMVNDIEVLQAQLDILAELVDELEPFLAHDHTLKVGDIAKVVGERAS